MFSQVHLFPPNPYPSPPPPPPIAHKVWILDCRTCGTFLTNRGMKAVLLLRPNVSLYSSDALPVNCSAYTSNPDVLRPAKPCYSSSARTCECLTQTLCCHGCGTTVGYMIVIPCARCTSSITATNRATNGHRFVFHSGEVTGTERHYIQDEPGVIPFEPLLFPPHLQHLTFSPRTQYQSSLALNPTSTPVRPDYLPTPPLEFVDLSPSSVSSSPTADSFPFHRSPPTSVPSQAHPQQHSLSMISPDHKDSSPSRRLKSGDVLFWHHLARHGEIPGVMEDKRARGPSSGRDDDSNAKGNNVDIATAVHAKCSEDSHRGKKMMFDR